MTTETKKPTWDERYHTGNTPWDHGWPSRELQRVLDEHAIGPCRALELGCGTGTNAVHLAERGFEVTAIDVSPRAIEQARNKAREAGVSVNFLAADFGAFNGQLSGFSFVFDRGFYHSVRGDRLDDLVSVMKRATMPGSLWLTLAGNANDPQPHEHGPPRVRAAEICHEWEDLFAVVQMREFHFDAAGDGGEFRPLAWSVLLRRR